MYVNIRTDNQPMGHTHTKQKPVVWKLNHWNPGILSAVLRYTYLEGKTPPFLPSS